MTPNLAMNSLLGGLLTSSKGKKNSWQNPAPFVSTTLVMDVCLVSSLPLCSTAKGEPCERGVASGLRASVGIKTFK